MKSRNGTDKIISEMLRIPFVNKLSAREKYLFRESLQNLVRLAKSEQIMEVKMNVRRLTAPIGRHAGRAARHGHENAAAGQVQQRFEFN